MCLEQKTNTAAKLQPIAVKQITSIAGSHLGDVSLLIPGYLNGLSTAGEHPAGWQKSPENKGNLNPPDETGGGSRFSTNLNRLHF